MEKSYRLAALLFITTFLTFSNSLKSQQEEIYIKKINSSVTFDGRVDEREWNYLTQVQLVMHRPNFGSEPSEQSEVYLGYDERYLWIGARLYMKDPSKIFCTSKRRDEMLYGMDAFGVLLDTYKDNENALAFFTAPSGLRTDFAISNDAAGMRGGGGGGGGGGSFGGGVMNYSWNTFWDVKTTRDDKGWYVEMRIPFSSLRFRNENDLTLMGLSIVRNIGTNNEVDTYPAIEPKYGMMAIYKPSLSKKIVFQGLKPAQPVYLSPYMIGGFTRDYSLNEEETGYLKTDKPNFNAGFDVKYSIKSNFTIDLTANTDFAQVEADEQQVNLTRYSLFFPEKRMFFQERSSLFNFSLGGMADNLFYSRNIGIAHNEMIRILGGARVTGHIGRWEMGFLNMQTDKFEDIPSENFGVLRVRRQVFNPNSYIGTMVTSRIDLDGNKNIAYGLDGIFKVKGEDYLNLKWAQTWDSQTGNSLSSLSSSFIYANWERRSERGFAYNFSYNYSGLDFNPRAGFMRRGGLKGFNGQLLYGWFPGEKSKIFSMAATVRGEYFTRIEDGKLENSIIEPGFRFNTKKGYRFDISMEYRTEGVKDDFEIADSIIISSGEYSFINFQSRFGTPQSKLFSVMGNIDAGQYYDGYRVTMRPNFNLNLSSSFRLMAGYEFSAIRFPNRDEKNKIDIHLVNANLMYMLSTKLSATLMLQYVSTRDDFIANFRLRYNPREGNDLYLVINDYQGFDRFGVIPNKPPFFNRTIVVKYTHTFIL